MFHSLDRILRPITFVAAIALCAGCAVLTIDVDVYKGPLSNHDDVQIQQIAAMAIGAKPLLIELRDVLEWGLKPDWRIFGVDAWALVHRDVEIPEGARGWYRPGYVRKPPVPTPENWFQNRDAIRANALLGLYHDIASPDVARFLKRGEVLVARYEQARKLCRPAPEEDPGFWAEYEEFFYDVPDGFAKATEAVEAAKDAKDAKDAKALNSHGYLSELEKLAGNPAAAAATKAFPAQYMKLKEAYIGFMRPAKAKWRGVTAIREAHDAICASLNTLGDKAPLKVPKIPTDDEGANANFALMQSRECVEFHAKLLFKGAMDRPERDTQKAEAAGAEKSAIGEAQQRRFVDRAVAIAGSFIESRRAIDELLELALRFVVEINRPGRTAPQGEVTQLTRTSAELAAVLVKTGCLDAALDNTLASTEILDKLKVAIDKARADVAGGAPVEGNNTGWYAARATMVKLIMASPAEHARSLLYAHQSFKGGFDGTKAYEKYDGNATRRRFGVTLAAPRDLTHGTLTTAWSGVVNAGSGAGLDRGRLPDGLETLIDDYVRKSRDAARDPLQGKQDAADQARTVLLDALARFAEKVLFIANYGGMLTPKHRPASLGNVPQTNTRVLQAVGNSILSHVDELAHRREYKKELKERGRRTGRAFDLAVARGPKAVIDGLLQLLDTEQQKIVEADGKAKDSDRADRLKHAIAGVKLVRGAVEKDSVTDPPLSAEAVIMRVRQELTKGLAGARDRVTETKAEGDRLAWAQRGLAGCSTDTTARADVQLCLGAIAQDLAAKLAQAGKGGTGGETYRDLDAIYRYVQDAARDRSKKGKRTKAFKGKTTKAVQGELANLLKQEIAANGKKLKDSVEGSPAAQVALMTDALREVDGGRSPVNTLVIGDEVDDPRDVLDMEIAALRSQQIRAQQAGSTQQADDIAKAIEIAYAHRSSMIYIRPTAAYLRSSYPATSLQRSSSKLWNNMLFEHAKRQNSHPWMFQGNRHNVRLQAEIDKQFWQNINRVRVAGAGRTNYVVAKDDVGNWYVKQYSANPEDIIKGMAGIAAMGAGGAADPKAAAALNKKTLGIFSSNTPQVAGTTPGNSAQLEQTKADLAKQTDDFMRDLTAWTKALDIQIKKDWKEKEKITENTLSDLAKILDSVEDPQEKSDDSPVDRLKKITEYRGRIESDILQARLKLLEQEEPTTQEEKEKRKQTLADYLKAKESASQMTDRGLRDFIARRQEMLRRHQDRLHVVAVPLR